MSASRRPMILAALFAALLLLVPGEARATYQEGWNQGRIDCRGGRIPQVLPRIPSVKDRDALATYDGWWDACDWEWNIPQDWRLQKFAPPVRGRAVTVDEVDYMDGWRLGWVSCLIADNESPGKVRDSDSFTHGVRDGCWARRVYRKVQPRGRLWVDWDGMRTKYEWCYKERRGDGGSTANAPPDILYACNAALDDVRADLPSALDSTAHDRVPPPAGTSLLGSYARVYGDAQMEARAGWNAGNDECLREFMSTGTPNPIVHGTAFAHWYHVACEQQRILKWNRARGSYSPLSSTIASFGRADQARIGAMLGEAECRRGLGWMGPDTASFGTPFHDAWWTACNDVRVRYGATNQFFPQGPPAHAPRAAWRCGPMALQLYGRIDDCRAVTPTNPGYEKTPQGDFQSMSVGDRNGAPLPDRGPDAVRPRARAQASSAASAPRGLDDLSPSDPRYPFLQQRDEARNRIAEWKARGLVGGATADEPTMVTADSVAATGPGGTPTGDGSTRVDPVTGQPIDPVTGRPIDPDTGSPIDPARSDSITQDRAREIELQRAREIELQHAREIEQQHAREIEQQRARDIEQQRARDIEQQRAREIEQQRAREIEQQRAQEVQRQRAQDIERQRAQDIERQRAQEVEWQRAQEIRRIQAEEVKRREADSVRSVRAQDVQEVRGQDVKSVRADDVRPVQSQDIEPVRAEEVRPTRAQEVRPVRSPDVQPFQAEEVRPSAPADEVTPRRPETGACTPTAPQPTRFVGQLRESTGSYRITVDFGSMPRDGSVKARVTILGAENRVLDGEIPGTLRGGALSLAGLITAWPYRWEHRLEGTLAGGTLRARAMTRGVGNAEWTPGEVTAAAQLGVDPAAVGSWAMAVPGAAYSQEFDRGSYVERVNRASAGAAAGMLQIGADGRYVWRKRGATESGRVTYCETPGGKRGWSISFAEEPFFIGVLDGPNGGFYLFSTRTGDYVYRGQSIR